MYLANPQGSRSQGSNSNVSISGGISQSLVAYLRSQDGKMIFIVSHLDSILYGVLVTSALNAQFLPPGNLNKWALSS